MGICESSTVSNNKKELDSLSSLDKYSTGEFTKNDMKKKKRIIIKEK